MKALHSCLLALCLWSLSTTSYAQVVPKTSVVEHFTNTYCSICASRNPGFYSNLANFPQVLHLAYYPSAPYPACPFNQLNKPENDARTNYYGVYGATPRLVVNGTVLPGNTNYSSPDIFQGTSNATSDYSLQITTRRIDASQAETIIHIRKVATNTLQNLQLFAVVTEDTVHFNANNGETEHYDLFHKSLTGLSPVAITSLQAVNDTVELRYTFSVGSGWGRTSVTALLQDSSKQVLQAARSQVAPASASVPPVNCHAPLCFYPVPASRELYFKQLSPGYHHYRINNAYGQLVLHGVVYDVAIPIRLDALPTGYYVLSLEEGDHVRRGAFVKQ